MVVEDVEDEDEEEDGCQSYPDNRQITNQVPPSDEILHPRTEIFSSADLVSSDVKLLMNFLRTPRVSWPRLVRRSRLLW